MLAKPESNAIHGYYFEDLSVGMSASYAKTITETDIVLFAGITGDVNPVHLNHEFATLEHLLLALTEDKDAIAVLEACGVNID